MSDCAMSEVALRTQDLRKTFEDGRVRALDGVSLRIERGESVAIVGPSGSGKTTLLNLLGVLDRCTSGEIWISGARVTPQTDLDRLRAHEIGFVFQLHNLIPGLTAAENVEVPMMATGLGRNERKTRALELLASVGLRDRADFRVPKLSGGERQRVAVARALANRPAILLADEPTGSLDSVSGQKIVELLLALRAEKNLTLILVTHDRSVASQMDRLIEVRDGVVVSDDPAPPKGPQFPPKGS